MPFFVMGLLAALLPRPLLRRRLGRRPHFRGLLLAAPRLAHILLLRLAIVAAEDLPAAAAGPRGGRLPLIRRVAVPAHRRTLIGTVGVLQAGVRETVVALRRKTGLASSAAAGAPPPARRVRLRHRQVAGVVGQWRRRRLAEVHGRQRLRRRWCAVPLQRVVRVKRVVLTMWWRAGLAADVHVAGWRLPARSALVPEARSA